MNRSINLIILGSSPNRRFILYLLFLIPLTTLRLRIYGFKRLYLKIARRTFLFDASLSSVRTKVIAEEIADAVCTANRRHSFYQADCMVESLVLWRLLRRRGLSANFCLGVRTATGSFESHAWVECEGIVLNDIPSVNQIYDPLDLASITPGIQTS